MKHLVLATILTSSAGVVSAQSLDGNALWEVCSSTVRSDEAFCSGYVFGVNDGGMYTALAAQQNVEGSSLQETMRAVTDVLGYCTPNTVNSVQMVDVFVAYLKENPELRHIPAQILFTNALTEAFPCE
ncbi:MULTISPECIES: Rap1a/Tai family immunity protein [unclassified Ruegeria]|uniref:Rap1a/Tai family immunity protein n=1 Tax=unclassified Ruegeria TaxID=2625375 RepID=UPI00148934EB|nr:MULTISPECIES: Rap1a/Tai family immunity protein [unclassified Ruegeria]NOC85614.1 hypothetical protein [Ruegeria sp. HKCCD6428]